MNRLTINIKQRQGGAALVVGLILLVVLTLMALSSMSTANLDLIMVKNVQYQSRAFTAAEAGIENALILDNTTGYGPGGYSSGTITTGLGSDSYSYVITLPYGNAPVASIDGNGTGYGAMYYRISSTGTSAANSTADHVQDLYVVVPASGDPGVDSTLCKDLSGTSC